MARSAHLLLLSLVYSPLAAQGTLAGSAAAEALEIVDVFTRGEEGYHTYRIPSILRTQKGTLLAFAEGRTAQFDHSHNDIVLKRSTDGGRTWSRLIVVDQDGENCLNNPTAVIVRETGRVLLMFQHYPNGLTEGNVKPGYVGNNICRTRLVTSDDDGITWSKPRDVTPFTKRPATVTSVCSGPGIGIQLRHGTNAGRIIIPFNEGPWKKWQVYAVYSDDHGETWQYGEPTPKGSEGGNEVQMVELSDGTVMLNCRGYTGKPLRKTAVSQDGGQTWSKLQTDEQLVSPACMGSIFRLSDPLDGEKSRILYSGPTWPHERINGMVRLSYDEGKTWPVRKTICPGHYAYSCLTRLADGRIGCLFETAGYQKIAFARFTLRWLTDGKDSLGDTAQEFRRRGRLNHTFATHAVFECNRAPRTAQPAHAIGTK